MNYWTCLIKPLVLYLRATLVALAVLTAMPSWATDFGVADWGMTTDQVRQLESRPNLTPFNTQGYLIYDLKMDGIDRARIVYQFADNRLIEGRFLFYPASELDVYSAVDNYQKIKTMMSGQYGAPTTDDVLSRQTDQSAIAPEAVANELASDRVILKTTWRSQTALMQHQLAWNGTKPHHQLHYVPTTMLEAPVSSAGF